jgi:hypothetical protein
VANLKRQFTGPIIGGVVVGVLLLALGMRDVYALLALALGGFVLAFYIPLGYFTDLALYRARQRRKLKQQQAGQR